MKAVPTKFVITYACVAAVGCLADLATKHVVFAWLGAPVNHPVGPEFHVWKNIYFQTSLNEGGLFGIGQGMSIPFAILAIGAVAAIVYWLFFRGGARDYLLTNSLGLITAGILGNLYDRLGLPGLVWGYPNRWHRVGDPVYAVRDWILVYIGNWPWPTFNIADSMLVCGTALLFWHTWRYAPADEVDQPQARD